MVRLVPCTSFLAEIGRKGNKSQLVKLQEIAGQPQLG